jgi:hypothetical protein
VAGIEIATPLPTNSAEHRNAVQSDVLLAEADRNPQPPSITNNPLNRWKRSLPRVPREVATLPAVIGENRMHRRKMENPVLGDGVIPSDAKSRPPSDLAVAARPPTA